MTNNDINTMPAIAGVVFGAVLFADFGKCVSLQAEMMERHKHGKKREIQASK
ncbi:MAG: hypothetical protein IJP44_03285 [Bacteroidales bacterium]|nr:hypothetical protein [Bacteroidales bacterium]